MKTQPEADPLDDLADQLASEWEPVANMMAPVQQLLASCKTLEEFRDRLPELVPQLDAAQVVELIAKGLFAGTLAGRTGAV